MKCKHIALAILSISATLNASAQTEGDVSKSKKKFADNVVAVAPIQLSENGVAGFGISYEHVLDPNGIIAVYVPAVMVINTNSESRLGANAHYNDPMFYVMPGIKLYPTGNQGLAKYAIGPSLVVAKGQRTEGTSSVYPYTSSAAYVTRDHSIFGMMVNQSLNVNPTPHLYIGTEFGFGFSYVNRLDGVNQPIAGLVQFSFKLGYRY